MSKNALLASANIRVTEVQTSMKWPSFRCIWMSLAMKNKKRMVFTKLCDVNWDHTDTPPPGVRARLNLCDVSAGTLADAIHDYIEKEELVEAVLQCVDLCENPKMSCDCLARILELLMEYQIQAVDLSGNPQLGDSIVPVLQPLLEAKPSRLTDLKLVECGLTVAGLKYLVKVASKSRLRLLDLSGIRIGDESELIEQVLELPMIEELAFRFCHLSSSDVHNIAEDLPFTSVKSLHLAGNYFGSRGLVHLASKLPESMVEELDLSQIGIEAKCEGLSQLAKAWVKRPFPKLYLNSNPMGQAEVMNFIATLQTLMPAHEAWMGNVDMSSCSSIVIGARRKMSPDQVRQFLEKCC